jgi:predicted DNA-binding protein
MKIYNKIISLKLDEDTYIRLKFLADLTNTSVSELIRFAIYKYLKIDIEVNKDPPENIKKDVAENKKKIETKKIYDKFIEIDLIRKKL